MNRKKYWLVSFIFLLSFLSLSSGHAEEKKSPPVQDKILTQSELSQCYENEKMLAQTVAQLKERASQLKAQKSDMSKLALDRKLLYTRIDFHSQNSVIQYNRINQQLNQLSQTYITDIKSFNNDVKQYQTDSSQLISECDNKPYHPKD